MVDKQKIQAMRQGGEILSKVRHQVIQKIKPGISLKKLDKLAEKLIIQAGAIPGFKLVPGYQWATCINLNQGIVHGIPNATKIKSGDLVTLDMGVYFQGFHTDAATTIVAGSAAKKQQKFLQAGQQALKQAIAQAIPNNRIGHISQSIQTHIESVGFNCIRTLTGHGVGKELHQPPSIPCFLCQPLNQTPQLVPGMTLAIEVIYAQGSWQTEKLNDGWTIITQDHLPAALFEETILITNQAPEILTRSRPPRVGNLP